LSKSSDCKVVLITRKTRLEELVARFNSVSQARFYIEHLGADFSDYQAEHQEYQEAMKKVTATLSKEMRVQIIERPYLPNFIFGFDDIVMALEQDGMVANTL